MRRHAADAITGLALALAAAGLSWRTSALTAPVIDLVLGGRNDVWFGGEMADVLYRMTAEWVYHDRLLDRPLVTLTTRLPLSAVELIWPGSDAIQVIRIGMAAAAALWTGLLGLTFRLLGVSRPDATLFTALGLMSAAAITWFGVPEIVVLGSLTILPALALAAAAAHHRVSESWSVAATAASLAVNATNGVVGVLSTLSVHPRKRAVQVTINALAVTFALFIIQQGLFPVDRFRFSDRVPSIRAATPRSFQALPAASAAWLHAMVMPAVVLTDAGAGATLSVHESWPGSGGAVGVAGLLAWLALVGIGLAVRVPPPIARVRGFLVATLLAQFFFQWLGAEVTFRSALQSIPVLLVLASLGALTTARPIVIGLGIVLLLSAGANNLAQFSRSLALVPPGHPVSSGE